MVEIAKLTLQNIGQLCKYVAAKKTAALLGKQNLERKKKTTKQQQKPNHTHKQDATSTTNHKSCSSSKYIFSNEKILVEMMPEISLMVVHNIDISADEMLFFA